jgi:hypothetical protein
MSWDVPSNTLFVSDIGVRSWEEINIITKGGNYGFAEREGPEQYFAYEGGKTSGQMNPPRPLPHPDQLKVEGLPQPIVPIYPVITYSHKDGDAVGSGFVYRGKLMPQLVGKFLFTDIPPGRLFYADLEEIRLRYGKGPESAAIHEIEVMYRDPQTASDASPRKRRLYDIVADAYARKGGTLNSETKAVLPGGSRSTLPGTEDPYGVPRAGGRADIRLSMGPDGEIYLLSRSDGMIRRLVKVVSQPAESKAVLK